MARLILDAGVLVAADRNDRRAWLLHDEAAQAGRTAVVPAPVLAQVWRGSQNANLARFVRGCRIDPLDRGLAQRAGELCGVSGTDDVVDAVVVASARSDDRIVTTDFEDLHRLAQAAGGRDVRRF